MFCVQGPTKKYAQRDLITNKDGVVEIPISFLDWLLGTTVHVKFRDHVVAKADGQFSTDVLPKDLQVKLTGSPKDKEYRGQARKFEDEIAIKTHPLSLSHVQQSLWAIRRVKPYTEQDPNDSVATVPTNRPAGATINGIVVQYNSGVFGSEKRDNSYVPLGNVFDNNWFPYMKDNDYLGSVEQALRVLKALFPSRKVGYHYHIERSGAVISVVEEAQSAGHAGASREPSSVSVEQNTDVSPKQANYALDAVSEDLNKTYIGIDVMGHHTSSTYQYTDHQVWYLDRLIENIQARRPEIKWHNILGHDEIRAAYKQAHPASTAEWNKDPGAALPGGMIRLRGRHGWVPS